MGPGTGFVVRLPISLQNHIPSRVHHLLKAAAQRTNPTRQPRLVPELLSPRARSGNLYSRARHRNVMQFQSHVRLMHFLRHRDLQLVRRSCKLNPPRNQPIRTRPKPRQRQLRTPILVQKTKRHQRGFLRRQRPALHLNPPALHLKPAAPPPSHHSTSDSQPRLPRQSLPHSIFVPAAPALSETSGLPAASSKGSSWQELPATPVVSCPKTPQPPNAFVLPRPATSPSARSPRYPAPPSRPRQSDRSFICASAWIGHHAVKPA